MESNSIAPNQQPLVPPPPHHFSKTFIIVLIILLISAVGAGGYFLGARKSAPPQEVACTLDALLCPDGSSVGRIPPTCEFAPCPTAASDETANWKVYSKDGFSFRYPKDLVIQSEKSNEAVWQLDLNGDKLLYQMWLKWQSKPFTDPKVGMIVTIESQSSTIVQVDANKTITLDSKPAESFYYGCGGDCYRHSVRFTVDNTYYELTGSTPGAGTDEIFVQILSTFRFD
ncbi:MAG: PsbP-related protein [Patescibacteria group bacterium]